MVNEVRLIDMNTLWQCETCFHHGTNGCKTWCDAGESYRPAASKFKIIDPETLRPKGRWEETVVASTVVRCSACKDMFLAKIQFDGFAWNFCPHCGADMRGDSK